VRGGAFCLYAAFNNGSMNDDGAAGGQSARRNYQADSK
jgi:hypothetical protein